MAEDDHSAQPEAGSSPVNAPVSPQSVRPVPAAQIPLDYATPGSEPTPNVLFMTFVFAVGFCMGVALVFGSGFVIGLTVYKQWGLRIWPIYFSAVPLIVAGAISSFRKLEKQPDTRWHMLGLLIGGGLACLLEGHCFLTDGFLLSHH